MSKNITNYIAIYSSTIISASLSFICNILATKILLLEQYGEFRYTINTLYLGTTIFNIGVAYSTATYLADSDKHEFSTRSKNALACAAFVGLVGAVLFAASILIYSKIFNNLILRNSIIYTPVIIIFILNLTISAILTGKGSIKTLAAIQVIPITIQIVYILSCIYLNKKIEASEIISSFLFSNAMSMVIGLLKTTGNSSIPEKKDIIKFITYNNKNGLKIYFGGMIGVGSMYLAGLISTKYISIEEYGLFSLGFSFAAPFQMICSIAGTANYRHFKNHQKIDSKLFLSAIFITIAIALLFITNINFVTSTLLAERYKNSGEYISGMAIYGSIIGIGDFINKYLSAKGKSNTVMRSSIAAGILLLTLSLTLTPLIGANGLILSYIISAIIYLGTLFYFYKKIY